MIGLAIAAVVGSPLLFLAVGFLGVSQKRAEDGRAHITPTSPTVSTPKKMTPQPTQTAVQPTQAAA